MLSSLLLPKESAGTSLLVTDSLKLLLYNEKLVLLVH